jgi:hypothetical protein
VLYAVAGGLGLALLALTFAAWDRFSDSRVPFTVLGYRVVSDTAVEVRFEVHKAMSSTVTCLVRARDRAGAEVGHARVQVGPSNDAPVRVTHLLPTSGRAATGEVTACRP